MPARKHNRFIRTLLVPMALWLVQVINAKEFSVAEFGAMGDGETPATKAIQAAIDAAFAQGGGRVIVPQGNFVTGTLRLKSNVDLHLEAGGTLLGSTNWADYEGNKRCHGWVTLLSAENSQNIQLSGKGTIDGRGLLLIQDIKEKVQAGLIKDSFHRNRPDHEVRPPLVLFSDCDGVCIRDITLTNGSGWTEVYKNCTNLLADGIKVRAFSYWENDGIDLIDCKSAILTNLDIRSEDDGICLKSDDRATCCENISVINCKVSSGSSAFKLGTASFGGFKNIRVKNLSIYDTRRSALSFFSVDGGAIENIDVRDVRAINTSGSIFIRLGQRNQAAPPGTIDGIHFENVDIQVPADGKKTSPYVMTLDLPPQSERGQPINPLPSAITGLPGHPVRNIVLDQVKIRYFGGGTEARAFVSTAALATVPEKARDYPEIGMFGELPASAFYVRHADGIVFNQASVSFLKSDFRPPFVFDDAAKITLGQVEVRDKKEAPIVVFNDVTEDSVKNLVAPVNPDLAIKRQSSLP
ncbi:MAG: glycosyl hydrolase family 28 protein [Verrucomicrobiae bacterium]|nr:glycosyl hydrolase family 28 protein [Verrucomicrobiae bacterium]